MRLTKRFDKWLCLHSKRYKLWRISKAIRFQPYKWQRDFALGKTDGFGENPGQYGKTMAIVLRLLLVKPDDDALMHFTIYLDPMYAVIPVERRTELYLNEYRKYRNVCENAGIPVVMVANDIFRTNLRIRMKGVGETDNG